MNNDSLGNGSHFIDEGLCGVAIEDTTERKNQKKEESVEKKNDLLIQRVVSAFNSLSLSVSVVVGLEYSFRGFSTRNGGPWVPGTT